MILRAKTPKEWWDGRSKKQKDRIRHALSLRDGDKCVDCGKLGIFATNQATVDHIKPLDEGGHNGLENLQLMCSPCNWLKDVERLKTKAGKKMPHRDQFAKNLALIQKVHPPMEVAK